MIEELPEQSMPKWLRGDDFSKLPIREVLENSVYYPACGFDGVPVRYLAGNFHSFVYVDYGTGRDAVLQKEDTFKGYHLYASRDVRKEELTPQGWSPIALEPEDGTPPNPNRPPIYAPFCRWDIYMRNQDIGSEHGPERFSLLYIGGDGVATFQALYHGNHAAPACVAIIQPEHDWGGKLDEF